MREARLLNVTAGGPSEGGNPPILRQETLPTAIPNDQAAQERTAKTVQNEQRIFDAFKKEGFFGLLLAILARRGVKPGLATQGDVKAATQEFQRKASIRQKPLRSSVLPPGITPVVLRQETTPVPINQTPTPAPTPPPAPVRTESIETMHGNGAVIHQNSLFIEGPGGYETRDEDVILRGTGTRHTAEEMGKHIAAGSVRIAASERPSLDAHIKGRVMVGKTYFADGAGRNEWLCNEQPFKLTNLDTYALLSRSVIPGEATNFWISERCNWKSPINLGGGIMLGAMGVPVTVPAKGLVFTRAPGGIDVRALDTATPTPTSAPHTITLWGRTLSVEVRPPPETQISPNPNPEVGETQSTFVTPPNAPVYIDTPGGQVAVDGTARVVDVTGPGGGKITIHRERDGCLRIKGDRIGRITIYRGPTKIPTTIEVRPVAEGFRFLNIIRVRQGGSDYFYMKPQDRTLTFTTPAPELPPLVGTATSRSVTVGKFILTRRHSSDTREDVVTVQAAVDAPTGEFRVAMPATAGSFVVRPPEAPVVTPSGTSGEGGTGLPPGSPDLPRFEMPRKSYLLNPANYESVPANSVVLMPNGTTNTKFLQKVGEGGGVRGWSDLGSSASDLHSSAIVHNTHTEVRANGITIFAPATAKQFASPTAGMTIQDILGDSWRYRNTTAGMRWMRA